LIEIDTTAVAASACSAQIKVSYIDAPKALPAAGVARRRRRY